MASKDRYNTVVNLKILPLPLLPFKTPLVNCESHVNPRGREWTPSLL